MKYMEAKVSFGGGLKVWLYFGKRDLDVGHEARHNPSAWILEAHEMHTIA